MRDVSVQEGCAAATVARVIAHAGVSRPTFYEYFEDRQTCFLAVQSELAAEMLAGVEAATEGASPAGALLAALGAIVEFARARPRVACFLLHEPVAAGGAALDAHDATIAAVAQAVRHTGGAARWDVLASGLFVRGAVGAVYMLVALRLRRGERELGHVVDEIERWLASYDRADDEDRPLLWRSQAAPPEVARSRFVSDSPLYPPPPLPAGRTAHSAEEVGHNHRERMLFACAAVACEKGCAACTVADIAAAARVDRRVFYRHFRDKRDAFHATLEFGFQKSIAATATAFFSASSWPERVWEASGAFAGFLATNTQLARFAFLEANTISPEAVRRFEDLRSAYTIFLQEGLQLVGPERQAPSATALEAIAALVFQTVYCEIRRGRAEMLTELRPEMTYICLAPFLGGREAEEFVQAQLAAP